MNCCPLQLQNFQRWTDNTEEGAREIHIIIERRIWDFLPLFDDFHEIMTFSDGAANQVICPKT